MLTVRFVWIVLRYWALHNSLVFLTLHDYTQCDFLNLFQMTTRGSDGAIKDVQKLHQQPLDFLLDQGFLMS